MSRLLKTFVPWRLRSNRRSSARNQRLTLKSVVTWKGAFIEYGRPIWFWRVRSYGV